MKRFSSLLLDLVAADPMIIVLDNDLSSSSGSSEVGRRYPENFLNVGVAEQNSIGVAAGLALAGFTPIVHTFAAFASMRACEQIRTSVAYQNLGVKLCVSKGGLAASHSGPTHHSTEDLAIMRAIPNMTVVAPKDFADLGVCLREAVARPGPVYLRMPPESVRDRDLPRPLHLGEAVVLRWGRDVTVAFTGALLPQAEELVARLAAEGFSASLIYCHTVKPLDVDMFVRAACETRAVITIEEHNVCGGFGSAVAELLSERFPTPILRLGIEDVFCCESGSHAEMLEKYCFDAGNATRRALKVLETVCGSRSQHAVSIRTT